MIHNAAASPEKGSAHSLSSTSDPSIRILQIWKPKRRKGQSLDLDTRLYTIIGSKNHAFTQLLGVLTTIVFDDRTHRCLDYCNKIVHRPAASPDRVLATGLLSVVGVSNS
jgi:hypothetical protein